MSKYDEALVDELLAVLGRQENHTREVREAIEALLPIQNDEAVLPDWEEFRKGKSKYPDLDFDYVLIDGCAIPKAYYDAIRRVIRRPPMTVGN